MVATKPEVLIYRLSDEIETRSQRLDPGFQGSGTHWSQCGYCDVPEIRKFKMAAAKPEVLKSLLPDETKTKSQRFDPGFMGSETRMRHCGYCPM